MTARMMEWWRLRSPREQQLLLVMAGLFAIVFVWLGVLRPVGDHLGEARGRQGRAVIALAAARAQADAIVALERGGTPASGVTIPELVDRAAQEAGFSAVTVTPEGEGAHLTIAAVRAQAFFGWIANLQRRHGLIVEQLSVRTNSDATLAVDLGLRGRGI